MKNIHVLKTDKPSRLWINNLLQGKLELSEEVLIGSNTSQHIYITSDEEIKEGDWCILLENHYVNGGIGKYNTEKAIGYGLHNTKFFKKIILTTDQDLIADGVQSIDDKFLEWFVKNPSCEMVKVEIESKFDRVDGHYHDVWEIIIPKEETLEEAKKYAELSYYGDEIDAFVRGAKWQQEQDKKMYSEEEVLNFTQTIIMQYKFRNTNVEQLDLLKETLEQFKKNKL